MDHLSLTAPPIPGRKLALVMYVGSNEFLVVGWMGAIRSDLSQQQSTQRDNHTKRHGDDQKQQISSLKHSKQERTKEGGEITESTGLSGREHTLTDKTPVSLLYPEPRFCC